jgi:hypothetical protein
VIARVFPSAHRQVRTIGGGRAVRHRSLRVSETALRTWERRGTGGMFVHQLPESDWLACCAGGQLAGAGSDGPARRRGRHRLDRRRLGCRCPAGRADPATCRPRPDGRREGRPSAGAEAAERATASSATNFPPPSQCGTTTDARSTCTRSRSPRTAAATNSNPAADHPGTTARPASVTATGARCLATAWTPQLRSHLGYEPDQDDYADMRALARRFECPLPAPYDRPWPS